MIWLFIFAVTFTRFFVSGAQYDNFLNVSWECLSTSVMITLKPNADHGNVRGRVDLECGRKNGVHSMGWHRTLSSPASGQSNNDKYKVEYGELYTNCGGVLDKNGAVNISARVSIVSHDVADVSKSYQDIGCSYFQNASNNSIYNLQSSPAFSLQMTADDGVETFGHDAIVSDVEYGAPYAIVGRVRGVSNAEKYRLSACRAYDVMFSIRDNDSEAGMVELYNGQNCTSDNQLIRDIQQRSVDNETDSTLFVAKIMSMFKFPGSNIVIIECTVEKVSSQPTNCNLAKNRRRRRDTVQNNTIIMVEPSTTVSESNDETDQLQEGSGEDVIEDFNSIVQQQFTPTPSSKTDNSPVARLDVRPTLTTTTAAISQTNLFTTAASSSTHTSTINVFSIKFNNSTTQPVNITVNATPTVTITSTNSSTSRISTTPENIVAETTVVRIKNEVIADATTSPDKLTAKLVLHVVEKRTDLMTTINQTIDTKSDGTLLLYQQLCAGLGAALISSCLCQLILFVCCCRQRKRYCKPLPVASDGHLTNDKLVRIAGGKNYSGGQQKTKFDGYWISATSPVKSTNLEPANNTYIPYYTSRAYNDNPSFDYNNNNKLATGELQAPNMRISVNSYASVKPANTSHRILDPATLACGGEHANVINTHPTNSCDSSERNFASSTSDVPRSLTCNGTGCTTSRALSSSIATDDTVSSISPSSLVGSSSSGVTNQPTDDTDSMPPPPPVNGHIDPPRASTFQGPYPTTVAEFSTFSTSNTDRYMFNDRKDDNNYTVIPTDDLYSNNNNRVDEMRYDNTEAAPHDSSKPHSEHFYSFM